MIYCNCEQEGQAEAYDIPTLSLQNYDLVKAEGKMRMREAHRTAQKDNLSTLGAAQESWGFVAKAWERRGVVSSLALRELKETGVFSELTCGSKAAFQFDNLNPCPRHDPSCCWTNPPGTQWASFFPSPYPTPQVLLPLPPMPISSCKTLEQNYHLTHYFS